MELPRGMTRLQRYHLPTTWTQCGTRNCVYNTGGLCEDPRINKGNGDAKCHKESNRFLLARLEPVTANVGVHAGPSGHRVE